MSLERLLRGDVVAAVAAMALLFVMALDWYSTTTGERARFREKQAQPKGALAGEPARVQKEEAEIVAEGEERNAWQESGAIDRIILLGLLATFALVIATAYIRAAGKRFEPPLTPSTVTAMMATLTALLVVYRTLQEPGFDNVNTVEAGAPLAVVVLAVIALAARAAMREEEEGTAWDEAKTPVAAGA